MKPASPTLPRTLGDCNVGYARCSNCSVELPDNAPVEEYRTCGGSWIVAYCPECKWWSPFKLEAA